MKIGKECVVCKKRAKKEFEKKQYCKKHYNMVVKQKEESKEKKK